MTLVRERRHHNNALRLALPPPIPLPELLCRRALGFRSSSSSSSSSSSPLSSSSSSSLESPHNVVESLSDVEKVAVLGHGDGATVYKVRHRWSDDAVYALKVVRFGEDAGAVRERAAREAEIFKRVVDSEFVVRCYGVFDGNGSVDADGIGLGMVSGGGEGGGEVCFVMEYMEAGSLSDLLLTRRTLHEEAIAGVARRVLEGLRYLHGKLIVHRDIKPSNLLIDGAGHVKIADFGVSRVVSGGTWEAHESYAGTCAYMSPERIDPEKWRGGGGGEQYSDEFAGDVWSLGVVLLQCHVGRFPLIRQGQTPDWAALVCAICLGEAVEMPETASPEFRSFVGRCLEKDWRRRGTVGELLAHPFITSEHAIVE